jgi:murein DD-endopeptidase MepM/ murein hydrolase activator NlpD
VNDVGRHDAVRRTRTLTPLVACFVLGAIAGWCLHAYGPPVPVSRPSAIIGSPNATADQPTVAQRNAADRPVDTGGRRIEAHPIDSEPDSSIDSLNRRRLRVPIDGVAVDSFKGSFAERRAGDGDHEHEAVDIAAPRNTLVHAVDNGTIAKLFESKAGGHTVYQFDSGARFCYYYAHLERYVDGLHDGQTVSAGDVVGYVGSSGNASTPHLHFAVFELGPEKQWWKGVPLDPYLVFRR